MIASPPLPGSLSKLHHTTISCLVIPSAGDWGGGGVSNCHSFHLFALVNFLAFSHFLENNSRLLWQKMGDSTAKSQWNLQETSLQLRHYEFEVLFGYRKGEMSE